MRRLEGQVAIVTGAGAGIGRAAAIRLAAEGAAVGVLDIDGQGAAETVALLDGPGLAVEVDISDPDSVARAHGEVEAWHGLPGLYLLNAGVRSTLARVPDVDLADFDRVLGVNVRGTFLGLQQAMRSLEAARRPGSIVIMTSIHGLRGAGDLIAYQISKHALVGMVRSAAVDGGPVGIRVNGIAPGIIPTPIAPAAQADMKRRAVTGPMRRAGTVEEIASGAAYLLSDDASYVTGHILSVDGGASVVNIVRPSGGGGLWDVEAADDERYGADRVRFDG